MARWQQTLAPFRGTPVVTYHESFNYFLRRFGLTLVGAVENRPGIPPAPGHLVATIQTIQHQRVKVLVADPFSDQRVAQRVARDGGARLLVLPSAVGAMGDVDTYLALFEHNVKELAHALR